jgi:hypothetical protein
MTEKLLTYATGRALKSYDMPVIRSITREAARNDNHFSSLILGIVKSDPFQMRVSSGTLADARGSGGAANGDR